MTGLKTILDQILSDANQEALEQLSAAKQEAAGILAQAKAEADRTAKSVLQGGEEKAGNLRERAESAAQMERRNAMLSFKQRLIRETIDRTMRALENAPDQEYFQILTTLAGKFAQAGKAEMRMNARDLARLPSDFEESLKQAAPQAEITISKEPIDIDSGFLLVYGGIDVNCTFEAIFDGAQAELRDAVSRILWKVTA